MPPFEKSPTASAASPTRILLIRHGQSEWNAVGRWQGQEDPPLTSLGRVQARRASGSIGGIDAVWASTLQRAFETGLILSEELGIGPVVGEPALMERDAGQWQGLTRAEVEVHSPGFLDGGRRPPGWESDEDLLARALPALGGVVEAHPGGEIAVVTHGGLIYAVEQFLGAPFERMGNLGSRWIEWRDGRLHLGDRLDLLGGIDVTVPDQL